MVDERQNSAPAQVEPIAFGRRLAGSEAFRAMFKEGMALVEETAAYLDGDGRTESRELTRAGSLSYATESMRLTTRLMQLASWLLLQRAVNEGEMSNQQARTEKSKVKFDLLSSATEGPGWDDIAGVVSIICLAAIPGVLPVGGGDLVRAEGPADLSLAEHHVATVPATELA